MKISYINGVCVKNDAISNSINDEINWLKSNDDNDVLLYTYACEHEELKYKIISGIQDIVFDPYFQTSDLIIFHFGIYYPLFNLLPVTPANAIRLVVFHNITPKKFTPLDQHTTIDKSFEQMSNIELADHVICDSQTNLTILRESGIQTTSSILPLAAHNTISPPDFKPSSSDGIIRIAFIGRFVLSKGPNDLLDALDHLLQRDTSQQVELTMIGNMSFSDPDLVKEIQKTISKLQGSYQNRIKISVKANASDNDKNMALQKADLFVLPTYHEGFCIPILEALTHGCRVIAYDNSNTPDISGGLARLVPTGDIDALTNAIVEDIHLIRSTHWGSADTDSYIEYKERSWQYTRHFSPENTKYRFLQTINNLNT